VGYPARRNVQSGPLARACASNISSMDLLSAPESEALRLRFVQGDQAET